MTARRVDIKVGFQCNNLCHFCVQGDKRDRFPDRPLPRILADLRRARREGIDGVVFTGGEPTLHRGLLEAVAAARTLGFRGIQIQTNGRSAAYPDYCRRLKDAGATEFSPALHGPDAKTHDGLTRAPGSFKQTVQGVRNAVACGLSVITNSVVTSSNYRKLPALARLLVGLGVRQYQFAFIHIVGRAWENRSWIVPRKSDAMPFIRKGLDVGLRAGVRCYTEAIPYCLMKGYEGCVAERIIPDGPVVDAEETLKSFRAYRQAHGKAKRAECRRCRWDAVCEGPWKEYPEIHGWDEFVPVKGRPR